MIDYSAFSATFRQCHTEAGREKLMEWIRRLMETNGLSVRRKKSRLFNYKGFYLQIRQTCCTCTKTSCSDVFVGFLWNKMCAQKVLFAVVTQKQAVGVRAVCQFMEMAAVASFMLVKAVTDNPV